jgi:flagellin-specific chaperone FliS
MSFFYGQIIKADTKKDIAIIEEILPQICELRDAFVEISKIPRDELATHSGLVAEES